MISNRDKFKKIFNPSVAYKIQNFHFGFTNCSNFPNAEESNLNIVDTIKYFSELYSFEKLTLNILKILHTEIFMRKLVSINDLKYIFSALHKFSYALDEESMCGITNKESMFFINIFHKLFSINENSKMILKKAYRKKNCAVT